MDYLNIAQDKNKKNKFIDKLDYFVIFFLIFNTSAFVMCEFSGVATLFALLACCMIMLVAFLLAGRRIKVNSNMAIIFFSLITIIGIGGVSSRGDDIRLIMIVVAYLLSAYFYAQLFDFDNFVRKYVNIIYFLSFVSFFAHILYVTNPSWFNIFPEVVNSVGRPARNLLFTTLSMGRNARNQGIFWEPGAFQTYINLALIFELFYFKNITKKRLIIYVATLITTYSTTGYIAALYIAFVYVVYLLLMTNAESKRVAKNSFFILIVVVIAIAIFLSLDSSMADLVFDKFDIYKETGYGATGEMTSASVRVDAFLKPFKMILKYPMFGAGERGMKYFAYNEGYNMNTCTFMNFFSFFGVFYGCIMMKLFWDFCKRFSKNNYIRILIFFGVFLITSSEDYYRNASILVFVFFPLLKESEDMNFENISEYKQL